MTPFTAKINPCEHEAVSAKESEAQARKVTSMWSMTELQMKGQTPVLIFDLSPGLFIVSENWKQLWLELDALSQAAHCEYQVHPNYFCPH